MKFFLIDLCNIMKCIIVINQFKNKKISGVSQNGSQEFLIFLVDICVDEIILLLVLICENQFGDLQNIWFEDFDSFVDEVYFIIFLKNWTSEDLGIS